MAKKKNVDLLFLQCEECKGKNYSVAKSKKLKEKFLFQKHCKVCKKHTQHKETKIK
jgi:large subunit ribosomal protein L33